MRSDQVAGDIFLALFVAKKIHDRNQTKQAAEAEGITYKEMRLRQKAAKYRARANGTTRAWRKRRNEAKAKKCDEKLVIFEATRRDCEEETNTTTTSSNDTNDINTNAHCYCNQCGATRVESARFCGKCGTKIGISINTAKDDMQTTVAVKSSKKSYS